MSQTLDLLVLMSAIATAEGYFVPGSLPNRHNNPGDLDFADQLGAVADGRFAKFDSVGRGVAANLRQICKRIQEGNSLHQLISIWAPPNENNTAQYLAETIRRIEKASGLVVDPDVPLWSYLELRQIS